MDTKSKSFNDRLSVRATAFALCVLFFAAACAGWVNLWAAYKDAGPLDYLGFALDPVDLLGGGSYEESRSFQYEHQNHIYQLSWIFGVYRAENAEETARQEGLKEALLRAREEDAARESVEAPAEASAGAGDASENIVPTEAGGSPDTASSSVSSASADEPAANLSATASASPPAGYTRAGPTDLDDSGVIDGWEIEEYRSEIQQREANLRSAERTLKEMERIDGLYFYVSDGETAIGDAETMDIADGSARIHPVDGVTEAGGAAAVARAFKARAAWFAYENRKLERSPAVPARYAGMERRLTDNLYRQPEDEYGLPLDEFTLYLAFDENFLAERAAVLMDVREKALPWIILTFAGFVLALALFVYLVVTTGRRDADGRRKLYGADRLFTELQLAAAVVAVVLLALILISVADGDLYWLGFGAMGDSLLDAAVVSTGTALAAAVGLWCLLSMTRCLKARRFLRNTLIWRLCGLIYRSVRAVYDRRNPMSKTVLLTLAVCLLSATVVLAPVVFVLVLVFGPKWVKKYAEIKRGVEEVKNGNLSWKIPVAEDARGEFDELARGINEISDASSAAIQNELKAQRLKTDLISGVSHDLKTPLTSIITYVDLLKREGPESPQAAEYIDVLDQKSQRLKKLTEDLFEAAKASSGSIPVRPEKVDLLSLIRQGLGEMNEGLSAQRLDVKLRFESERHYVRADGQLLWRIVENLLGNVQKYALEGSRVYIDLSEKRTASGGMTVLEIKNMSKAQLNISAEELMERFTRGDASRATEGSGLGLAIAKDLARLQNGWFELKIDGDLFKAVLMLETWEEPAA